MAIMRLGVLCVLVLGLAPAGSASPGLDGLTRTQAYSAQRASSANPDLARNGDSRPIEPGQTLELAKLEGPGVITHIWCTVASDDPFYSRALILRIYWDGADHPSVEAPLGDFFGVGHGAQKTFTSIPVVVASEGRARSCFWRMPFHTQARVTVTNESADYRTGSFYYYLDWEKHEALPEDTVYFHAQYRQAFPAEAADYTLVNTRGRGHYVGTVYSAHQTEIGWFGEGDDRFYVDGEAYPSLSGTGTEDYFGDAWGFREFATPYFGVPLFEGYFPGDRVTAYRWHITSPVPFQQSLRVDMEPRGSVFTDTAEFKGQFLERQDWLSSVAFWYQSPVAPAGAPLPPLADRMAPYRILRPAALTVSATVPEALAVSGPLVYLPPTADAAIDIAFTLDEPGRYQVNAILQYSFLGGVYQPYLNGTPLGSRIDFCINGDDPRWVRFDLHDLEAGTHTLRFEGRGYSSNRRSLVAPPRNPINGFRLNALVLLRLEDMAGYQSALKASE